MLSLCVAGLLATCVISNASSAASRDDDIRAARKFKVGDTVEVTHFREVHRGTVAEIDLNWGRLVVQTPDSPLPKRVKATEARKVKAPSKVLGSRKPSAAPANDESDPFATDEEKFQKLGRRSWSDRSGKFRIDATIVRIDDDKVVLKRADNKEVTVPRSRLSDEDQAILDKLTGAATDASVAETSSQDRESTADDESALGPQIELTPTDLTSATTVDLTAATNWNYQPDPSRVTLPAGQIPLPWRDVHERVENVLITPGAMAFVVFSNAFQPGRQMFACSLAERKLKGSGTLYANQVPLDVGQAGKRLLSRSDGFGFGKNNTLYLYALNGFKAAPIVGWQPMGADRHQSDIAWAKFVDDDHVLTLGKRGQIALWDVSDGVRAIYTAEAAAVEPVFSPGRKYVLLRSKSGVAFVHPLSGQVAGFLEVAGGSQFDELALRPDGKKLAVCGWGRIRVWNLETRELERDFCLEHLGNDQIHWCDDQRLITGGGKLIDVDRRLVLWRYTDIRSAMIPVGGQVWGVRQGLGEAKAALIGARLPHGDAVRLAEKLPPDSILVIRPGMEVSVQVTFPGTPQEQAAIRKTLTSSLEEVGMKVVDKSPVSLVGSVKRAASETVQYRTLGTNQVTTHNVPKELLELSYVIDGKPVWTYSSQSWTPHMLRTNSGESIDQALARETKQNAENFESIFVPGYVAAMPAGIKAGESTIGGN